MMNFEHLQQYYPDLTMSEHSQKGTTSVEMTKEGRGKVAVFRTTNNSANLRINPDHIAALQIVIPQGEAKPPSLPFWRTLEGLSLLYSLTLQSDLEKEIRHASQSKNPPRFFASGKATDYRDPFPKLVGTKLLSADFNLAFLPHNEYPAEIVEPLLKYVNKEIAQSPQLLGVYELRLLMEYTKAGKDVCDDATFMLFCIAGLFTKVLLSNGKREFDRERSTQIVSRKVTSNKTIDDTILKTSRVMSRIAREQALANPFQGGKADGNQR